MTLAATKPEQMVQASRVYQADIHRVFAAWSDPQALGQWFGPASHRCVVEVFDFQVGGDYRIRMIPVGEDADCAGDHSKDSICGGKFVDISKPNRIVMSFTWLENGGDIGETLLTIELDSLDDRTRVRLTHEPLLTEELRQAHASGWEGSLESLARFLQAG